MAQQVKFSVAIRTDAYQNLINSTLGDKEVARKFVADISSVVSNNFALSKCDAGSIISAGLTAQSLNLPLSQTLGFAYIIPYGNKAQFQIGKNGLVQLALRTAQYEKLGVRPVHKGELLGLDEFGEEQFKFSHDLDNEEVVGYMAYLKLVNGFSKKIYWTKEQCEKHGRKYSKSYHSTSETNLWKNEFDDMAQKTVLKQLISKWGIMSTELQLAIQRDQAVINQDGSLDYIDRNEPQQIEQKESTITNSILPTENEETGEVEEVYDTNHDNDLVDL